LTQIGVNPLGQREMVLEFLSVPPDLSGLGCSDWRSAHHEKGIDLILPSCESWYSVRVANDDSRMDDIATTQGKRERKRTGRTGRNRQGDNKRGRQRLRHHHLNPLTLTRRAISKLSPFLLAPKSHTHTACLLQRCIPSMRFPFLGWIAGLCLLAGCLAAQSLYNTLGGMYPSLMPRRHD